MLSTTGSITIFQALCVEQINNQSPLEGSFNPRSGDAAKLSGDSDIESVSIDMCFIRPLLNLTMFPICLSTQGKVCRVATGNATFTYLVAE